MKRKKAFIGALIGAVGSVAGSLISSAAQERAMRKQQVAQNKIDTINMANNIQNGYADQSYADEYNDKLTFRTGGRFSSNQVSYRRKFSCGGRKH